MSEEAKKIIDAVQNGNLPPLPSSNSSSENQGDQYGINKTTFGLQPLNEGVEGLHIKKDSK